MSYIHKEECKRIWKQLGCEDDGKLSIADIVKHSRYLERCFPELLEKHSQVAIRGSVSWEAFQALYLGMPAPAAPDAGAGPEGPGAAAAARPSSLEELRRLFEAIDVDMSGSINLNDVINAQTLVARQFPEMLTKWSEIDEDDSGSISWDDFRHFFGGVDDWLEYQLGEVVGLEDLKSQIRRFYRGVMLDEARRKKGHNVGSGGRGGYHMIFRGNPGTGKTSMGRLMARLLYRVGIAPNDTLKEVQQEQLVAGFVGQTAPKTQKVIEEAAGGILFIDEAYRLSQGRDQFGKEAIEQLMGAMNEPPGKAPIMVFAGYPPDMEDFMKQNDGLYRRIPYTFDFPNYSCAEMAEILEMMVSQNGFTLENRLLANGRQRLARIIETKTLPQTRALMNGGLCERIFAFAKQALDARDDHSDPSVLLVEQDVVAACQQIPPPPEPGPRGEGGCSGDGGAAGAAELREMRERFRELQDELARLRDDNAQLRREAEQGTQQELLAETTLRPAGGTAVPGAACPTMLGGTVAMELKGIRELLKEVRRLKAEVQGRDERVEELQDENRRLQEALEAARHCESRFPPGARVQYFSGTVSKWIDAVVQSFDLATGTYHLDVKRGAPPERVRRHPDDAAPDDAQRRPPQGGARGASNAAAAALVAEQFRRFDANGDGCVDRDELAQVLRRLEPDVWPDDRVDRLLAAVDIGSDGKIQYEEFIAWAFQPGAGDGQAAPAELSRQRWRTA